MRTWKRPPCEPKTEIDLTPEQKRQIYSDVVLRMYKSGIMSEGTYRETLKRVTDG